MRNVQCPVCKEEPRDYYMVLDEIWRRLPKGLWRRQLCIKCLETTLGITLGPQDFKKIPLRRRSSWLICGRRSPSGYPRTSVSALRT